MHHVKPHGALYNMSAKNLEYARAIAEAVFEFNNELPVEVTLFNVLGQKVLTFKPKEFTHKQDLKNTLSGVYLAKIVFENRTEVTQIIKK